MIDIPSFDEFWKRWRGKKEGRLANQNEGREEARVKWNSLVKDHKILAHQWGPHFQREFRKANGDDCSMLHCCRYLGKKRFLNYEDEELPGKPKPPEGVYVGKGSDQHNAWMAYTRTEDGKHKANDVFMAFAGLYTKGGHLPSEWPPGHEEAGQ